MKISVIVPMYNMEQYIARCLSSLVNQDICKDSYEIIVVNDGSTDNSVQVVESIIQQCGNITLITQTNQGLSGARNTGLKHAKGKYIWFVDSDDWVDENCLSRLVRLIEEKDLDILEFNYIYVKLVKGKMVKCIDPFMSRIETKQVTSGLSYLQEFGYIIAVTTKIIKKSLFDKNKLFFPIGVYAEDNLIVFDLMLKAEKYLKVTDSVYCYYQREGSITNNKDCLHLLKYASNQLNNILLMKEKLDIIMLNHKTFNGDKIRGMISFLSENLLLSLLQNYQFFEFFKTLRVLKTSLCYPLFTTSTYLRQPMKRKLFRFMLNSLNFLIR